MNLSYCFTKRVPGALIFVSLMLSACSGTPDKITPADESASLLPDTGAVQSTPVEELKPTNAKVMEHVFAAEAFGAEGDFSSAASEYLEAALASDDPEIAERAAKVAVASGEWQKVAMASDRWAVLQPESIDALQLAAGSRLREEDYTGAEYQLGKLLNLTRSDPTLSWEMVAKLLASSNDRDKANKVITHLIEDADAGSNPDALFARSTLAARNGDLQGAADWVQQAIDIDSSRADFLAWSGTLAVNLNNDELALERYRQARALNPSEPGIAMAYAELLKRGGDLESAYKILEGLPDIPEKRFSSVVFALDAEDKAMAMEIYRGFATAQYDDPSEAAFNAAQSAELLELPHDAISWYAKVGGERALRAQLRSAFLYAGLGELDKARQILAQLRIEAGELVITQSYQAESQILKEANRPKEAMLVLNAALQSQPDDEALRYERALLAVDLQQLDLAESDLRQIIEIQPENATALNALGYTLVDLTDRYEEAQQYILKAYELQPLEPSIIDSMGWLAYRLNRLDEAERYLQLAWASTESAEIAAHLGEVLWANDKQDEAREIWTQGLDIESDNVVLLDTLKRFGQYP